MPDGVPECLHSARADIIAKNLTLTADQAAKFWRAYSQFQAEQPVVVDQQLKAMKTYARPYATLDDAAALAQVGANLDRDLQINTLRKKWLVEFQKILPARIAAPVLFRSTAGWAWRRNCRSRRSCR